MGGFVAVVLLQDLHELENSLRVDGISRIAGVDEVGRGPLAGPVVAAAVIFSGETHIRGVRDSKLVPPKLREILYEEIFSKALSVGVGFSSVAEIDRMNILQASLLAMKRALTSLSLIPNYILIDGNQTLPNVPTPQQAIVQGDRRCFSIAAASIVAKVHRDRIMREYHQQYPEYGFDRHKGYCTPGHIEALKRYGRCEIHRRSFQVKELLDLFVDSPAPTLKSVAGA
jgi:ribonuclease HII